MPKKTQAFTLEEGFALLEETIVGLEAGDISLEASFQLYSKGMQLIKQCNEKIERVEKQVMVLEENGETHEF